MTFFPNSRTTGLEISSSILRVLTLRSGLAGAQVESVNELALDKNPWLKNGVSNKKELAQKITQLLAEAQPKPIKASEVVAILPESVVFSKVIHLPKLSARELAQTIPYEAAESLPLPLEEMYLDWQIDQRPVIVDEQPMLHIMTVAVPKKTVDDLSEVLASLDLKAKAIETQPFAIGRCLKPRLTSKQEAYLIVQLDPKSTTLALITEQALKFTSTVGLGATRIQANLSKELPLIADEIEEVIHYYRNRLNEQELINTVFLTGSGALIDKLPAELSKLTHLDCQVGYSKILLPNGKTIHPRFNAVIGGALRR